MRTFKIVVAYDGTRYHGWQVQRHVPTVAQTMQNYFLRVFGEKVNVIGVSRTDAGVHARGQVATFTMKRAVAAGAVQFAWNNVLPDDIRILECYEMPVGYSPFIDIAYKEYHYHIIESGTPPFYVRYGWRIQRMIDYQKLYDTLQLYVGEHDFRSFSTGDDRGDNSVRTINSVALEPLPSLHTHRLIIKGPAFLRYMIRRMVGAAMEITLDAKRSGDEIRYALAHPRARQRFLNAPACGLTLHKVVYNNEQQQGGQYEKPMVFL